jgi:hypothetical protein
MAEQSAFLTAYDEMQKKKGGFNAPAPLESVVDTVGQAPAVQSPFGQQAGLDAISREQPVKPYRQGMSTLFSPNVLEDRALNYDPNRGIAKGLRGAAAGHRADDALLAGTNPLAAPIDLSAVRQAPMLGGFEVKGAGAERFDVGTPEVPETLFSKEYTDPGGNTAAIARIEDERARANAVDPQVSVETPKEFTPTGGAGFLPASSVPVPRDTPDGATFMGDVSTALGKLSAPFTAHSQAAGGFKPEQPAAAREAGPVAGVPEQPAPAPAEEAAPAVATPVMDGSQIPQAGEEGFKFAERGSPQDYFLSNTNGGTTALSPEQITRGQEYAKQQGLNFDPTTGFSQSGEAPQVQAPQGLTTAGGQPLAEFLAGDDAAPSQQLDAQGRMIDPNVDRSSFEQASADREARQAARPDFGTAVSDRDRRAARGDGISDADRSDIAKANQRGASAGDVARGDKVAEANGIDRKTGKPLEGDGLTFDQQLKLRSQKFNEGKFEYEATKDAKELYDASLTEAKEAKTAEAKAESVGKGLASSVADMRDVMGRASGRLDGFFSTDMVGKAASFWKGSDADAQEADFAFLKSNVALNAMMELKANSPTGSTGFGALNTEELKVLTNQFATLDPFTDSKLVRQNLKQLNERFEGIIQNAYNTHAAEYGKEAADGVYGSMVGGKQAQGQSNQAPSGKSVTTPNGKFTATAVID